MRLDAGSAGAKLVCIVCRPANNAPAAGASVKPPYGSTELISAALCPTVVRDAVIDLVCCNRYRRVHDLNMGVSCSTLTGADNPQTIRYVASVSRHIDDKFGTRPF